MEIIVKETNGNSCRLEDAKFFLRRTQKRLGRKPEALKHVVFHKQLGPPMIRSKE